MSNQPPISMHGAVDLSALAKPASSAPQAGTLTISERTFQAVVEQSLQAPVIIALVSDASPACGELVERLGTVLTDYPTFAWGVVDVDAEPAIAQAFQVTAVPTVLALLGGRPAPLFQGNADDEQIRSVMDQVNEVAAQAGQGTPTHDGAPEAPEEVPALHQEAYDALERDDLSGAIAAFEKALVENPKDDDARAGLAQVRLMSRTRDLDLAAVRAAAAQRPDDVDAQLAVADLDIAGGMVDDAFVRLIDVVRTTTGDDRERVRARLVDLFDIVGSHDARVVEARKALAAALY